MLSTAADTYKAFLDGIKKSYTDTVEPITFTRIINDWGIDEWLKQNVSEDEGVDSSTKQLDDLQMLKVVTDGSIVYNGDTMYNIIPDSSGSYLFSLPDGVTAINNLGSSTGLVYPKYMRKLGFKFKITYVNNECGLTGVSDYLKAQLMRSGERASIEDNEFLKPKDHRLYYEFVNNKIRLITGTSSTPYSMWFEYLRFPRPFYFDKNRNVKSCITITSNATAVSTIVVTYTTALGAYVSTTVNVTVGQSKYTIAQNIYNAIVNNLAIPASVRNYTSINLNTVSVGQFGYDGVATIATTGTPPTYTITTNATASDVNIELPEQQRKEVVEQSVRIYLERVSDVSYKTYLTEETIRDSAKK